MTVSTVLSDRPPTLPMDKPCPPEQTPPEKVISYSMSHQSQIVPEYQTTNLATVHSHTVILVVDISAGDNHVRTVANIESIGVMAARAVSGLVVDSHIGDSQPVTSINADRLNRGVLDVEIRDSRIGEIMRIEELGLRLAPVTSLAIPPTRSIGIQVCAVGTLNRDAGAFNLEQGAIPLLVTPGGLTFENDLEGA